MKGLIWNIWGIGNAQSVSRLKFLISKHNLIFVAIIEPKLSINSIEKYRKKLRMSGFLVNSNERARIWLFWKQPLSVYMVSCSVQHATVNVSSALANNFVLTIVHASCSLAERRDLWNYLVDFAATCASPWLVGGDFNSILDPIEKKGGRRAFELSMTNFQACVSTAGLEDAGYSGSSFTWYNG